MRCALQLTSSCCRRLVLDFLVNNPQMDNNADADWILSCDAADSAPARLCIMKFA